MALTDWSHRAHLDNASTAEPSNSVRLLGLAYGLSAFVVMCAFWAYFVAFLANAPRLRAPWTSPSVDVGATLDHPALAALVNLGLIALFGLQHSLMARPRLKAWWAAAIPPAFVRVTYVHAANAALWMLVLFWQPLPGIIWQADGILRAALWTLFVLGWITLLAGALSFGLLELLGIDRVWGWYRGLPEKTSRLKTHWLYDWVRHPMYVGVLLGVWATPRMTVGHALLAAGLTLYVMIAMRYEERDLRAAFGEAYQRWRSA